MWRGLETWHGRDAVTPRNRKGEETVNTNIGLNRRASLRPYWISHFRVFVWGCPGLRSGIDQDRPHRFHREFPCRGPALTPTKRERSPISASTATAAMRSMPRIACRTVTTSASDHSGTASRDRLLQTLHALTFLAHPLQKLFERHALLAMLELLRHEPSHMGRPPSLLARIEAPQPQQQR